PAAGRRGHRRPVGVGDLRGRGRRRQGGPGHLPAGGGAARPGAGGLRLRGRPRAERPGGPRGRDGGGPLPDRPRPRSRRPARRTGSPSPLMPPGVSRPTGARSRTVWITRLRLASGLVLFTYLATHFANHALGLVSLAALEDGRVWFLLLWRNPLGTLALYGALLTHLALALGSLYRRRHFRRPAPLPAAGRGAPPAPAGPAAPAAPRRPRRRHPGGLHGVRRRRPVQPRAPGALVPEPGDRAPADDPAAGGLDPRLHRSPLLA